MNNTANKTAAFDTSKYTHGSYAEALKDVKKRKDPNFLARWDAGEGWTGEAYYCNFRKRVAQRSINPEGMIIV